MTDINAGITYADLETLTPSKLHTMIDGGDITEIDRSNMGSQDYPMIIKATEPSDLDVMWFDTTTLTFNRYETTQAIWAPYGHGLRVVNNTGATIDKGTIVNISGADNEVDYAHSLGSPVPAGVLQADLLDTAEGVILSHGLGTILVTGAGIAGEPIVVSGVTGFAVTATGGLGFVTASAGIVIGHPTDTYAAGTGLVTCYMVL